MKMGLWGSNISVVLLGEAVESSMGHVESHVNQQGHPCKAKYSWVTDNEIVP